MRYIDFIRTKQRNIESFYLSRLCDYSFPNFDNNMLNQQHPILNTIDSYIEPLLRRVLQTERFGKTASFPTVNIYNF